MKSMRDLSWMLLIAAMCGCSTTEEQPCPDPEMRRAHADDICTEHYEPVCGCDGRTYGNACHAQREGVRVAQQGECP
jgi:hypothetical protein